MIDLPWKDAEKCAAAVGGGWFRHSFAKLRRQIAGRAAGSAATYSCKGKHGFPP